MNGAKGFSKCFELRKISNLDKNFEKNIMLLR